MVIISKGYRGAIRKSSFLRTAAKISLFSLAAINFYWITLHVRTITATANIEYDPFTLETEYFLDEPSLSRPWQNVAPSIDTDDAPLWFKKYILFHKRAIAKAKKLDPNVKDTTNYMIFYCNSFDQLKCSGTANQQRAIFAALLVSILTERVFLIDIDRPIRLDHILSPNLIQWNYSLPDQKLKPSKSRMKVQLMNVRNRKPPPLNFPSQFMPNNSTQVIYIRANAPANLRELWATNEMQTFLAKHNTTNALPAHIYKWFFSSLFKPMPILSQRMAAVTRQLSLTSNSTFVGVHIRTGDKQFDELTNSGAGHGEATLQDFLKCANRQKATLPETPIILLTDQASTRTAASKMDPFVKYANTRIIHTDLSTTENTDMEGNLNVWVDIFLLTRANCTVKTKGSSFSTLGSLFLGNAKCSIYVTTCGWSNVTVPHL